MDISKKRHRIRIVIPSYPAFNIYTRIARKTTALGPVCVASSVKEMEGWDVEVIDENNFSIYGPRNAAGEPDHEYLQKQRPADIIGFYGGLTSTIPQLYRLARFYKQKGIVTIAGGQHFCGDTIAEALSSSIDYVVLGEGEETIKELLAAIEGKRKLADVKGIAYIENNAVFFTPAREPIRDFERLPLPDFSLVRYANLKLYPVERIRGCGMDCEFCTVKGKPRSASPERLIDQISFLLETRDARHFFIVDDLFGQQRDETVRFCGMLRDYQKNIGRRLDFTVQIRLDKAKDSGLLAAMRQAGINTVAIGFESPIEEELKVMKKHVNPDEMISLARIFRKFGFLIHGMFIFGYPKEQGTSFTMPVNERVKRYRDFVSKADIDTLQVLLPVPLPGTELRERLLKQNRIYPTKEVGWEYYDGNFPLFEPDKPLGPEEMQAAARKIMGRFYRFPYLFMIGWHVLSFPAMIFFLYNIKYGWRKWYRLWRNSLIRIGGWAIIKGWNTNYNKGDFSRKLHQARKRLNP